MSFFSPFLLKMTQNVSNDELVHAGVQAARESAGFTDPSTCTAVIFDLCPKPRLEVSSETIQVRIPVFNC